MVDILARSKILSDCVIGNEFEDLDLCDRVKGLTTILWRHRKKRELGGGGLDFVVFQMIIAIVTIADPLLSQNSVITTIM